MFDAKDVKRALTWIFSLYDEDDSCLMLDDDDVVSSLMPEELSRKYRREAHNVMVFFSSTGPKDKGGWSGTWLFKKKAVRLCEVNVKTHSTYHLRVQTFSELWLLSNMKFAEVRCVRSLALRKNTPVSVTECRTFVKYVKTAADLFVDADTLFYELDDSGHFEKLFPENNTSYNF